MNPKVSVIMPVYNSEKYLRQCLDTVINQTLKEIEIICVDDGSTDGSLNILLEYMRKDNRISVVVQKNKYAGVARNTGLKLATGEYLSFLDSDDLFDLDMLEKMYETAKKDNSDTVVCEFYEYDSKTNLCGKRSVIRYTYSSKSPFSPKTFSNNIFCFCSLNPWTKLFRRKMFIDNSIEFSSSICCNDISGVCTALACSNRISVINTPFIRYRMTQESNLTASRNRCPDGFLIAVKDLENNLKRLNLYRLYREAFVVRMKSSFKWEMSLCNDEQKQERKQLAKKILSDELYKIFYNERE